jgi:hypothetical protein
LNTNAFVLVKDLGWKVNVDGVLAPILTIEAFQARNSKTVPAIIDMDVDLNIVGCTGTILFVVVGNANSEM